MIQFGSGGQPIRFRAFRLNPSEGMLIVPIQTYRNERGRPATMSGYSNTLKLKECDVKFISYPYPYTFTHLLAAFVIISITYATAYRSGAQINPAVTIALLVTGKIRAKEAVLFIACQILGAVIGAAVVYSMFGSDMAPSLTLPADNNVIRALILETIMTFTAVYVILTTLQH